MTIEQTVTMLVPFLSYAGTYVFKQILDARDKYLTGKYRQFLPFISVAIGLAIVWILQLVDQWFGANANPAIVTLWGAFYGALGTSVREMVKQSRKLMHIDEE